MFGWRRRGAAAADATPFGHLRPGRAYRVVRAFVDHDGIDHPVGETWTFRHSTFLPYEDGLSLFVVLSDGTSRQIRLQQRRAAEGPIVDALYDYILPVADRPGEWPLLLTRDSVCMADDVDAPHARILDVAPHADAAAVAAAILGGDLAWVGGRVAWSIALAGDRVLFGYRYGLRFVWPVGPGPLVARADAVERLHVTYLAQADARRLFATLVADGG